MTMTMAAWLTLVVAGMILLIASSMSAIGW
jgi:hypothetical protein